MGCAQSTARRTTKDRQQDLAFHYNGPYEFYSGQSDFMKRVITAVDIPARGELRVPTGSIVTASAREVAAARGVRIVELPEEQLSALAPAATRPSPSARTMAGSA